MNEPHDIEQIRSKLYEEVWTEPMVSLAVKYNVSDTGLRKRCKALNIPLPPAGYWAKVKAGKTVPARPFLPSYSGSNKSGESGIQVLKKDSILHLIDLEDLTIEQLNKMHDFDLLLPGSLETFSKWCESLTVPGRIHCYHALVSKHQLEMEYREKRDKEHPFSENGIKIWNPIEKVKYRDNEAVIPINVSTRQYIRACRIADTILKSVETLNAICSVARDKEDNVTITLLSTSLSFEIIEQKTKRRNMREQDVSQELRPVYEEIYDGRLQISWTAHNNGNYYSTDKTEPAYLLYGDEEDNRLENQISIIIFEIYRLCCNNEIINGLEREECYIKSEEKRRIQSETEEAEKQLELEKRRKAKRDSFISELPNHADNWFKHNQLLKFADELENSLVYYQSADVDLLQKYIKFVRENADGCNPINNIIEGMRSMESLDEN